MSSNLAPADGQRIYQLQSLRFVAAALVLYGHVLMEARQHGSRLAQHWTYDLPWGGGVDIFFVISGFIILFIGQDAPRGGRAALDFAAKRAIRLVPLYWLFTLVMAAVLLVLPARIRADGLSGGELILSLLFIPYAAGGEVRPILGQGWTLNFEAFFYLLFAIAIALTRRRFAGTAAALLLAVVAGATVPLPPAAAFLLSPFLLLFVAGMTLARFRAHLPQHDGGTFATLVAAAVAWAALCPPGAADDIAWRLVARGIPAILLVYATLQWRSPPGWATKGLLPLLGDASYALYLSHPFVVNAVLILFAKAHLPLEGAFVLTASLGRWRPPSPSSISSSGRRCAC